LDTPGHAAFSAMRARGAKLTDIAVIVIAADDGIMPQTREVIKDCRQANVQIMVAINKCDLPAAKPDRVRQMLQSEGLTPEEWGGDVVCCEVSAHTGQGMDNLLEMILLQADVLELQANPNRRADGYVIEAQMELGRGPTATLLVASGTLKMGDVVLIDEHYGRLRGLVDDRGRKVSSVGPAQAVRVMGLSGVPEAGAEFRVMTTEKRAKELAEKFAMERKAQELQEVRKSVDLDSIFDKMKEGGKKKLSIIVKADTQGTVEAICDTLRDIRSEKIDLEILSSSIGNITANDVQRASAGKAMIVGFQVNTESGVAPLATHDGIRIRTFSIIYELFDHVRNSMLDMLDPEYREVVRGHAQIRQIFDIGGMGRVAGCQLLDGIIRVKDAKVRVKRNRDVVWEGRISSLRHFRDEVPEVKDLQECGIFFDGFEDFQEGDVVECFSMEEIERTL
ncbi:MAG: translation initiation factor IF-2, partial [Kiritimatiellae bacterium]|nr:translation initiation factor IF-2 [Kiritimatiellia bacterium]